MQTVKETVQAICNILQSYGLEAVDPNMFRQAKHNMMEAIKPMSYILHNLLLLELYDFEYRLQEISVKNKDEDGLEIILLALRNCPFIVYKNGKPGMDYSSSRDLLLIIGQILAEGDVFEKHRRLIEKKVASISVKLQRKQKETTDLEISTLSFKSEGSQITDLENLQRIIKHQFKQLHTLLRRKDHQTAQIQKIINQMNLKDYSVETLICLQDQEQLNEILTALKEIISYLEFETQFHRHQEIFWAWMESIVEEDKKEFRDHADYGFPDESILFPAGQQMLSVISMTQQKLSKLSDTFEIFESISSQFEESWEKVSLILQEDPNQQQKLQQLQLQVHKIVAQNTIRMINFKTFKDQIFSEKDLMFCQANDVIKYILRQQLNQHAQSNQYDTNGFEEKLSQKQLKLNEAIEQLQGNLDTEIKRIKGNLKEIEFFPK